MLRPVRQMNIGMEKAANPKHFAMKKSDIIAPIEPQMFWNSLLLLSQSPCLISDTRLWSASPVLKYEMKAMIINTDTKTKTRPNRKLKI